jgi:hypothetical protein
VGQPHVVAHRERLRDRHKPDQPMLQHRLLLLGRHPGKHPQPLVHLQRIAGDRNRILPPLPQQLGKRDSYTGLADTRWSEDSYNVHQWGGGDAPNGLYFFVCGTRDRERRLTEKVE